MCAAANTATGCVGINDYLFGSFLIRPLHRFLHPTDMFQTSTRYT